jgi:hypothetical protein
VHRDILECHSGFFEDKFATPSSEEEEGTSEDTPLCLNSEQCNAQAFTVICKFLYPEYVSVSSPLLPLLIKTSKISVLGSALSASAGELDYWEPVLDASVALEIGCLQNDILKKLGADKKKISKVTPRLLNIANRLDDDDLRWDCYYDLVYRAHSISRKCCTDLGSELALITTVRERVRNDLMWELTADDINCSKACLTPDSCREGLVEVIHQQMQAPSPSRMFSSVFDIGTNDNICQCCDAYRVKLANSYRTKQLDQKVEGWIEAFRRL